MKSIFADLLDICVLVYLDNILIYSDNSEDHERHVREVLRRLWNNKLYARADKCSFHNDTVEYLGYILGPNCKKSRTFNCSWVSPISTAGLFTTTLISVPLTQLTWKGTPWSFSNSCRTSFETLKKAFTTAPVLAQWEPGDPLIVETDGSDYTLGAILSTITPSNNQVHPVTFHSRTFTSTELNYDVHDKELLAIFEVFKCSVVILLRRVSNSG